MGGGVVVDCAFVVDAAFCDAWSAHAKPGAKNPLVMSTAARAIIDFFAIDTVLSSRV